MTAPVTLSHSIERQLGEVVGTLRMTVAGMESLKESVERLTERAAFRGDVEALRAEQTEDIKKLNRKVDTLQRWMWVCVGGGTVFAGAVAFFIKPIIRVTLGT